MTEYILSILAFQKKKNKKTPESIEELNKNHLVIEIDNEPYYCYDNIGSLSQARSIQIDAFLKQEADMNIDRKTLEFAIDKLIKCLDPSDGGLQIGDANLILMELKKRLSLITLPEHIYRVAALCFFKSKEDVENFLSPNEIERRAELLKKKIPLSDLLGESMSSILKTLGYSTEDFQSYLQLQALQHQFIADSQRTIFTM